MMFVGECLKQTRTKKNIDLLEISKELNISISYLEAIENDDFSKTPPRVYTIGFIRAYANYLNLDSNEIVDTYKTQISFSDIPEPIVISKPLEAFFPLKWQYSKIVSFIAIVSISISFYILYIDKINLESDYAITSNVPEGLESIIEEYEVESALSKVKNINKENINVQNNTIEVDILTKLENEFQNNQISVNASKSEVIDENEINNIISLKATNLTWIQLRNIKNEIVYSKLMNKNDVYNYSFNDKFTLTVGNAGNIIISIGGNLIGKLGKKGEVLDSINISSDYFSN